MNEVAFVGNRYLNKITSSGSFILRVEMEDFEGNTAYSEYNTFNVGDASTMYELEVNEYHGTGGNFFWSFPCLDI